MQHVILIFDVQGTVLFFLFQSHQSQSIIYSLLVPLNMLLNEQLLIENLEINIEFLLS